MIVRVIICLIAIKLGLSGSDSLRFVIVCRQSVLPPLPPDDSLARAAEASFVSGKVSCLVDHWLLVVAAKVAFEAKSVQKCLAWALWAGELGDGLHMKVRVS